jgi:hypothetical protein
MSIPRADSRLVAFSTNFHDRIVLSPERYGLSAPQAAAYSGYHDSFVAAYNALVAARESGTRSESLTSTKDAAKNGLLGYARQLYGQVQSSRTVTEAAKIELGVTVRRAPSPHPVPATAPQLTVVSVDGCLVKVRLSDTAHPGRTRLPDFVNGAVLMSYVGEAAPNDPSAYTLQGTTSRATLDVMFPGTLAPGTKVWLVAAWFNQRKQLGPACKAVGTNINYGGSMRLAA